MAVSRATILILGMGNVSRPTNRGPLIQTGPGRTRRMMCGGGCFPLTAATRYGKIGGHDVHFTATRRADPKSRRRFCAPRFLACEANKRSRLRPTELRCPPPPRRSSSALLPSPVPLRLSPLPSAAFPSGPTQPARPSSAGGAPG